MLRDYFIHTSNKKELDVVVHGPVVLWSFIAALVEVIFVIH
jgi:hypothetical protein